ncbi:MAG TPA: PAS domain S-box protein [Gammaproteobacteria bacterium]|nr:PAS domain S-box protein [Gammaproteobacteria bacterium]
MTEGRRKDRYGVFVKRIRSLPGRLLLSLLAIHLVLAPLLVIFVFRMAEQNYQDRFIDQSRSDAQWVQTRLESRAIDSWNVQALLDDLVLNPFRQSVQLFDSDGIRIAGAGSLLDASVHDLPEDFGFGQHGDGLYWIAQPLRDDTDRTLHTLRIAYDEAPISKDINRLYSRSMQLAAGYLLLVVAAVAAFGNYLSRALRQIGSAAHRIATGHIHDRFRPSGNATEIVELAADLEHMRADLVNRGQLLEEQRLYLRMLLDHIAEGVVTFDFDGRIETCNPAALEIFGYQPEQAAELVISDWLPGLRMPPTTDADYPAQQHLGQRRDGSFITVELTFSMTAHQDKQGYLALIRDISERKRIENEHRKNSEELAHARRLSSLGEMAASLAHELNQPLAAITLYIQGGLRRLTSAPGKLCDIREALENAGRQAQRAGDIIERIRGYVKKAPLRVVPTDINQLVHKAAQLMETETIGSITGIRFELCEHLQPVALDPVQIQQVLVNLISNGIEAMKTTPAPERLLTVRTGCNAQHVNIAVEDRGCGISADIADRLFEPFVSGRRDGIGLGLAISRSIAEKHGGSLDFKARAGGGTVFTVALPLPGTQQAP